MAQDTGAGPDRLAPVIPLFGATAPGDSLLGELPGGGPGDGAARPDDAGPEQTPEWCSTWDDESDRDVPAASEIARGLDLVWDECADIEREIAESTLVRKLRTRQLSVSEARTVVSERDLDEPQKQAVLDGCIRRGWLDDRALAEQVVRNGSERKGQGRTVIAQTLARRGIPREIADDALAALPDDDSERALAYARAKAPSMRRLDHAAAVRRLTGQLMRRGYPGAIAQSAARDALGELGGLGARDELDG